MGVVWLVLFGALAGLAGWGVLSLGSGDRPVAVVDRLMLALPAGLVIVTAVSFLAYWPLGIRFSRLSLLLCAAITVALVAAASRLWSRAAPPATPPKRWRSSWDWLAGAAGAAVIVAFAVHLGVLLMKMPIAGWDFYLYHWHIASVAYQTGAVPANVSPSYMEAENAYPPWMFLVYADVSHMLGHLSQLGPRLLPLTFTIGLAAVCGRIARVCLKLSVGASLSAAAFALWSGYYIYALLTENTDTVSAFFFLAGVFWVLRTDINAWPRAIGGGIFLAGAYWTKYNGFLAFATLAPLVLVCLLLPVRRAAWRKEIGVAAGSLAIALLFAAPHLLRNAVLFGNPAYPALASFLGGFLIDPWVIHQTLPFWQPVPFYGLDPGWWHHPFRAFPETGPVLAFLVAAAPLAIIQAFRSEAAALQLLGAILIYGVLYLLFLRAPGIGDAERYLLIVVALAAPLAGLAFETLSRFSLQAVWVMLSLGLILVSYVRVDREPFFSDMNRILVPLLGIVFALGATVFLARVLGQRAVPAPLLRLAGLRLQLLPIFALPLLGIWASTDHACLFGFCNNGYIVRDGLQQLPQKDFIVTHLGDARYLTFDDRISMLGGNPFPGDHPALESFYTERLDGLAAVNALKALGIRYIYWTNLVDHPLMRVSPLYTELEGSGLFTRIYSTSNPFGSNAAIYELR